MNADPDGIDALLASISDGRPIDWESAERTADAGARDRLAALREMSRIAEFNRGLQRGVGEAPPPAQWGELLLLERIGASARAEVYRAWDPTLQRDVALKLLRQDSGDAALLEEGRALARVRHPHVVTVHGVASHDGRVGLWMELVRGATLEQTVRTRGPLSPAEAARLAAEIGGALAAVHAAGLLHRDVTPANIVREAEGRFVLADFGLGLRGDALAGQLPGLAGTPMYMAPELLAGVAPSERSDLYALGMTVWFALAGRPPFEVTQLSALVEAAKRGTEPLRSLRADVPAALAAVVQRAIAPAPERRPAHADEWLAELLSVTDDVGLAPRPAAPTTRARRRPHRRGMLAVAFVLATITLGILSVWLVRARREPLAASPASPAPEAAAYSVSATLLRRDGADATALVAGDRVRPGDRLSLEVHASRPAWVYVLNEDERGARYLLFPEPRFDVQNPIAPDAAVVLPGPVAGHENAWTVTSAGGREHFLVVVSPAPIAEIEADLSQLPAAQPGRPVAYARVGEAAVERLRGVGGVEPLPRAPTTRRSNAFDRFRALAGQESGVRGVWVRQIVLENPAH